MKTLVATLVILISLNVQAENGDLDSFLADYLKAFGLNQNLSEYFISSPHFIFGEHLLIPASRKEAGEVLKDIRTRLKQSEYSETKIMQSTLRAEIDSYSFVSLLLHRYKTNGELLDKVCSSYGVLNGERGYEIISWQPSNVNIKGQCE
jgi:hypothetical protein